MTSGTHAVLSVTTSPGLPFGPSTLPGSAQPVGLGGEPSARSRRPCAGIPAPRARPAADLRGALAALLAGGDLPRPVRDEISASWQRSAASGLKPDQVEVPFDPDFDGDGLLVRAARPVLDQLAIELSGARVGVVLTDARGQVIDRRVPDACLNARLDRISFAPGFVYAEDVVGTNGIGTALVQRRPTAVEGDEHFADALTTVACAGAPISDAPSGRILGVIDLTCLATEASPLMLPLATRAGRDVEQRVLDAAGLSERIVLQRFLQRRRGAKGPLVFITERTMITNAAADRLVEADDEPVLRECATRLLSRNHGGSASLVLGGTAMVVHTEPILEGAAGAMLRLTPIPDGGSGSAHRDGRRPTFGWDSLTHSERSVTELVALGLTNREVAERLFLSHHTVGFHLRSIYRKLGIESRVDLTRMVMEHDTERDSRRPHRVSGSSGRYAATLVGAE
jgi:DNA-binding CsgD family transcriptional regulator